MLHIRLIVRGKASGAVKTVPVEEMSFYDIGITDGSPFLHFRLSSMLIVAFLIQKFLDEHEPAWVVSVLLQSVQDKSPMMFDFFHEGLKLALD